jgi:hypothetical protein
MTPFAQRLLEADVAAQALANILGESERANQIRSRLRDLRRAGSSALLAELATHPDQVGPEQAVKLVIEHSLTAGLDWPTLVAMVNTASERRAV